MRDGRTDGRTNKGGQGYSANGCWMAEFRKIVSILQVSAFCGLEEENCVANQTLKGKSCLIPCTGLYADIVDDYLKQTTHAFEQNVMQGKMLI